MKKNVRFALLTAALGLLSCAAAFAEVDCNQLAASVKGAVAADLSATLQVVEKTVMANPGCACEVVKAAIEGSKAEVNLVAAIVETAVVVAPEHTRLIAQCAVAVAPDALPNVTAVLARRQPPPKKVVYGHSAKSPVSAKGGEVTPAPAAVGSNPLDFPGSGIADPPVRVGGFLFFPYSPGLFVQPIITPPAIVPGPGTIVPPIISPPAITPE
jgi:hypothetical protein